ncbi:hypothetical protein [Thaumasiovibrio sp. DFM-14]|uniref:hypothetical protein n=1 Tax=Thaumasiovibrio sp. DFM-14 TaxID=3384792 RepID=UPI0039A0D836
MIGLARRGVGSTSEGLAYGFITGDLSAFTGRYTDLDEAWCRLDGGQKQAVIDTRNIASMTQTGENDPEPVTVDNFVSHFVKWLSLRELRRLDDEWCEANPELCNEDGYAPEEVWLELKEKARADTLKGYQWSGS